MSKWLGKLFGSNTAVVEGRKSPAFLAAVQDAAVIYQSLPEKQHLDESSRQRLSRQLYLDLHEIFNATGPVEALRQRIASAMLRFSLSQVLLIPPAPEPDPSGLRGLPGITGGLTRKLDSLAGINDDLHSALYEYADSSDKQSVDALLRRAHCENAWRLQTFNAARRRLADVTEGRDWFRPFLFAACANQEHGYRRDLDLPPAFDSRIAASAPIAYSLFTDIVLSGARNPLQEWLDYHRDAGIPMPLFDE